MPSTRSCPRRTTRRPSRHSRKCVPRYLALHDYAEAIALDHTNVSVVRERRAVQAKLKATHAEATADLQKSLEQKRTQVRRLKKKLEEIEAAPRSSRLPWRR